jgi:hypothetical protein
MSSERPDRGRLQRIFGTEIPQESSDERDPDACADAADRDRNLRDNVPPHHI